MNETLKWPYGLLLAGYCLGLFFLSHQSEAPVNTGGWLSVPGLDKVVHVILYGGLAVCCSWGLRRSNTDVRYWVQYFVPVIFAMLYGLSDEIHQLFVPKRNFDWWDWCADCFGAGLAQLILCKGIWKLKR